MANNSGGNLDKKIDELVHSIEILVDVVEKRGRANRASSMYHISAMSDKNDFLRDRSSFNITDFNKTIDDFVKNLENSLQNFQNQLKETEKIINDTAKFNALSQEKQEEYKKKRDRLKKNVNNLSRNIFSYKTDKGSRENLFKIKHEQEINKLKAEYDSFSEAEKRKYGSEQGYIKNRTEYNDYIGTTQNRNDAADMIARSGFGNTAVGRYGQTLINRQQRFADIGNFGNMLKTGGAEKIGAAIGGGKAGAFATKALGGFGKGLGVVSKFLGGPFVQAIFLAIDALKKISEAVNDWKKYTAEMYDYQRKQEQYQYELSKQQMVIENQIKIENISAQGDIQMKMLEAQGATMLDALKLTSQQYAKSVETSIGPLTKGINQSAYDAMKYSTAAAADYKKLLLHQGQRETEFGRYSELRELQKTGKLAGLEAEKGVAESNYITQMRKTALEQDINASSRYIQNGLMGRDAKNNLLNSNGYNISEDNNVGGTNYATGGKHNVITNSKDAGLGDEFHFGSGRAFLEEFGLDFGRQGDIARINAMLDYMNQSLTQQADYNKTSVDMQYQLATTQKDYAIQIANKQLELATSAAEIEIDTATEIRNMFIDLAQKSEQWIEKFDRTTNDLAKNLGYTNSNQIRVFQDVMFENAKIAAKFGKTTEEIAKVQQSYIENTGRNRLMGQSDTAKITALGAYLGDDGLAANYASEMEIFNAGVSDSVDMLDETLQDVNRIGLNGRKYTKTLVDNLKLAQRYNFKDGTKGLMRMAKWAENTRFNLSSLGGMLDKISEGGLEGIITQGAQFQVLGGHAAMNADPIAMWYERYADPEALMKRYQDMTKGYGQVDKETGETKFSGNEVMMMEQIAKIQGRSLEEVQNEVRARNKKERVAKELKGNFDEDQQAFISNNATYDKETGQFKVKVKQGNEYVEREVNQLSPEDLKNIMPEEHNKKIEKYMEDIVDLLVKSFGEEERERIEVGKGIMDNTIKNQEERIAKARANFEENKAKFIEEIIQIQNETTQNFTNFLEMASKGNAAIDTKTKEISAAAANIGSVLQTTADIIAQANGKIASAMMDDGRKSSETPKTVAQKNKPNSWKDFGNLLGGSETPKTETPKNKPINWRDFGNLLGGSDSGIGNSLNDGIVTNNNKPIVSQATNVTKINDGLVQSDPKDVAIFAKEGGVIGNFLNDLYSDVHSSMGGSLQLDTVNVQISGSLDLSSGGQSVDIINELQNNPILLRSLSRMLAQHISSAMNGGRGNTNLSFGSI